MEILLGLGRLLADWGCSSQVLWLENTTFGAELGSELNLFLKPHWGHGLPGKGTAPGLVIENGVEVLVLPGPLCG